MPRRRRQRDDESSAISAFVFSRESSAGTCRSRPAGYVTPWSQHSLTPADRPRAAVRTSTRLIDEQRFLSVLSQLRPYAQ
jgi:hypothetical protein